ncbi:DNA topoisomerase-3 [Porphyromonadaceae bacterium KH3CP3RA]|nr:DNA topoisomerase-3 [Porphyromonadaceae bacterium KH3CP3RA]
MKVIIAEKPSVARDIAAIVGATARKDGYMEGNNFAVTWAFGHLVGLALPEQYGITGYQRENLPILPDEFKLIPRQVRSGKEYQPDPGVLKQLKIIKELFNKSERIVVATDAGREGELIFRFIYHYLGCTKPFDRLWISSLTDQAIRKGMDNLMPGSSYDNLYHSAKARSQADWLVGINASQALSITAGRGVWSLGRVQTPTLAMICSRYIENKDFKPQTYFQLRIDTEKDSSTFSAVSDERYSMKNDAEEIFERVRSAESISVLKVEKKQVNQESPLLYDLTALQKEANKRFNFSADKTLSVAQSLYEAKLISYPRTGSRYISDDVFAEIPALIDRLSDHPVFGSYARELSGRNLNKRTVNDKKVTDHHALLITENVPIDISKDQRTIYDMIAARMLESFSGKCTKENTTVSLEANGVPFTVKGSVIVIHGWRAVMNAPEEDEDEDTSVLPVLQQGDTLSNNGVEILEKQTKPRPLHTEASLLSAMETCGKELTDESEREALKESGIGTPATRASIIETLFAREYIEREKKSLVPTNKGMVVYLAVKDKKIADVSMTGAWENALNKISNGDMDADSFHKGIEVYAAQITNELLESKIDGGASERKRFSCPKCKEGRVTIYQKVAKCNNEDCGFILFRNKSGKDLTDGQIEDLITKGKTGIIKGFKSKENKPFDAVLSLNSDCKPTFDFNSNKRKKSK